MLRVTSYFGLFRNFKAFNYKYANIHFASACSMKIILDYISITVTQRIHV